MGSDNFRPKIIWPDGLHRIVRCGGEETRSVGGLNFPPTGYADLSSLMSGVGLFWQEIHLMFGGEPDHLGNIGQFMEVVEQRFQLAGR